MPEIGPLQEMTEQEIVEAEVLRGGNRRLLTATLSLASLLAVGVAIGAGYMRGLQDREEQGPIPLLRAQVGEVKSRPENPGGIDPPDQDKLIYNRLAPGQSGKIVERVRPAPEEPLASAIAEAPVVTDDAPAANAAPDTHAVTQDAQVSAPAISEQTVSVPAAEGAPKDEIATASTGSGEDKVMETPAAKVAATEPAAGGVAEASPDAAPPPTKVAARPEGMYRVQLASFRTEKRAETSWKRFAKSHGNAFATLEHFIVPADLGERGIFYRVQAGPFADKESAKEFCGLLLSRGKSCIVVRK